MIEINVLRILHNVQQIRRLIGTKVKLCAVVKGDGYGCGDVRFSKVLQQYTDVDMLATAMTNEALHLRMNSVSLPILVLCDTQDDDVERIIANNITPSVYRMDFARKLSSCAGDTPVDVHVRLDVCSGSPGMLPEQFLENLDELLSLPGIRLAGVYTQLYGAYVEDKTGFEKQLKLFDDTIAKLPAELREKLCIHAASTTATCICPQAHYDMVRVGAALYGLPFDENPSMFLPVMSIRSRIISLKTVVGSAFTGYNDVQQHEGERRLATVGGGYEDALYLMFVRSGFVLVRGKRAPIVGEACMDTMTIDVTDIPEAKLNDEVVLLGQQGNDCVTIVDIMRDSGFTMANCQLVFKTGKRTMKHFVNYPQDERWKELLGHVMQHSPTVRRAMETSKSLTLRQYVEKMADFEKQTPLSDPQDLNRAVQRQLKPVLGDALAAQTAECFPAAALTANHHGVDCFAQSVQGNLLYRELLRARGVNSPVIPVLACSSVPMDNSSYGKGLLLFDTLDHVHPLRLPILPNKVNDSIVGLYPAMEEAAVRKAIDSLNNEKYVMRLSEKMRNAARHILADHYLSPEVMTLGSYSQQSTAINYRLTKEAIGCGFAYVDMEKVASELIAKDLTDESSLIYRILQERSLRTAVLERLNGATGCWDKAALRSGKLTLGGTAFFWAVDKKWTRTPMMAEEEGIKNLKSGEMIRWEEIGEALNQGRIYPALLLCFTALLFARGIRCFGGYFQPEYLRVMKEGLMQALRDAGDEKTAWVIGQRDPSGYISGPIFLEGEQNSPMGIVEMFARKMSEDEIISLLDMNFEKAHKPALANMYIDVVPALERLPDYREILKMGKGI